jgi:tetratricopeptide (TPR) repeat protein
MATAELLFEQRQFEPSLEQLDQILRIDPQNPEVRLLRSAVLMELGRKAIAQSELQQIQKAFPGYPAAALQAGYFALARQAYAEAEGWFRKVFVPGAADLRALNGLVEVRLGQGSPDAAMALLRQDLAKRAGSGTPVRELLTATAVRIGRFDEALKEYESLVQNQPDSAAIRARYAEIFRLSGNTNEAIVQYQKATDLEAKSAGPAAMLGYLLATTQRFPEARTALEKAHALAPRDPEILNNLAFLLAEMKVDLPTASAHAQAAMRLNPQERRYRDTLGWIYAQSRQFDSALQLLRTLTREEPANALYRYHLAFVLLQKGEMAEAKKTLNEALALKPSREEDTRIRELLSKAG